MRYSDLLDRMRNNDTDAFLEMTDKYSWAVYSAIREKHSDPAVADKIYNEAMNTFYHSLLNDSADDPLESLLCAFADQISVKYTASERAQLDRSVRTLGTEPPKIQISGAVQPQKEVVMKEGKKNGFWYGLGMLLVLTAIAAVLWCIVGLLMDMNFLPYYDLGFSWFNANIMQLF